MIGQNHVRAGRSRDFTKALGGLDIPIEPEAVGPLRRDVAGPIGDPVEGGPAPIPCDMTFGAVAHRDQRQIVPSVCPGVRWSVNVVSPNVSR